MLAAVVRAVHAISVRSSPIHSIAFPFAHTLARALVRSPIRSSARSPGHLFAFTRLPVHPLGCLDSHSLIRSFACSSTHRYLSYILLLARPSADYIGRVSALHSLCLCGHRSLPSYVPDLSCAPYYRFSRPGWSAINVRAREGSYSLTFNGQYFLHAMHFCICSPSICACGLEHLKPSHTPSRLPQTDLTAAVPAGTIWISVPVPVWHT